MHSHHVSILWRPTLVVDKSEETDVPEDAILEIDPQTNQPLQKVEGSAY